MASRLLLTSLRWYFVVLARLAPRIAGRHAYWLFSRPRRRGLVPLAVAEVMARAETFEVRAGAQRVVAYRWPARGESEDSPRVMLAHGWESRAARLAVWVEPLREAGFEVVAFDAPAHGLSEGRRANPLLFVASMQAVVERVGPVSACIGHSLGGFASLLACGGGELLGGPVLEVERLVILAGAESGVDAMAMFCDILGLGRGFLPLILGGAAEESGRPVADFDAHNFFPRCPVPTLWLHDPEDTQVPYEAALRVVRLSPHVAFESTTGLGHHQIARDPEMIRRGVEFLSPIQGASRNA